MRTFVALLGSRVPLSGNFGAEQQSAGMAGRETLLGDPSGLYLVDGLYLVQKGERLSNRIAGTKVVPRLSPA